MLSNPASRRLCTARADVVGPGNALQHLEQSRCRKRLRSERDPVHTALAEGAYASFRRDRLRVRLHRQLSPVSGNAASGRCPTPSGSVNVGVPPPRKTVSNPEASSPPPPLQLREKRVGVGGVASRSPTDRGHEVAVPAAVRAERQVDVEMTDSARCDVGAVHASRRSVTNSATERTRGSLDRGVNVQKGMRPTDGPHHSKSRKNSALAPYRPEAPLAPSAAHPGDCRSPDIRPSATR